MRLLEIHIESEDVKKSIMFYKEILEYEKILELNDKRQIMFVMKDGCCFGIWEKGFRGIHDGRGARHLHFAFQIPPSQYRMYKVRLEALGIKVSEHEWNDGERSMYFFDPDGNQGEFMTKDWLGGKIGTLQ